jgi:hypothetical protein
MARINVDSDALQDPRIVKRLPRYAGLAPFDALGRLLHVWALGYARKSVELSEEDIEEAAALYAAHFLKNSSYVRSLKPVQILKLSRGVDYQSCETDDWRDTLAWRQLDWINGAAVRSLHGYEDADWSYDRQVPEIDSLYERTAS